MGSKRWSAAIIGRWITIWVKNLECCLVEIWRGLVNSGAVRLIYLSCRCNYLLVASRNLNSTISCSWTTRCIIIVLFILITLVFRLLVTNWGHRSRSWLLLLLIIIIVSILLLISFLLVMDVSERWFYGQLDCDVARDLFNASHIRYVVNLSLLFITSQIFIIIFSCADHGYIWLADDDLRRMLLRFICLRLLYSKIACNVPVVVFLFDLLVISRSFTWSFWARLLLPSLLLLPFLFTFSLSSFLSLSSPPSLGAAVGWVRVVFFAGFAFT